MAYLDETHRGQIVEAYKHTLPHLSLVGLLVELSKIENALRILVFTGSSGAGSCVLSGAKVGDKVLGIVNLTDEDNGLADFETTISVVDEIQQSSGDDLSTKKFVAILVAKS